jgi:serine carboxypeptidase-like clade 2
MISSSTFETMKATCNFSDVGPIKAAGRAHSRLQDGVFALKSPPPLDDCDVACDRAMGEMGPVNIYQLFADVCPNSATTRSNAAQLARKLAGVAAPQDAGAATSVQGANSLAARSVARAREVVAFWAGKQAPSDGSSDGSGSGFPAESPCVDDFVNAYLNRPDVRQALHVRSDAGPWSVCTDEIDYSVDDVLSSMLPLYPRLIAAGLRVWVFSGDVDGIVPTSGSRAWVEGLRLKELEHWRPWLVPDGALGPQVGGYVVGYQGLTFATVRGAGHMGTCPRYGCRNRNLLAR